MKWWWTDFHRKCSIIQQNVRILPWTILLDGIDKPNEKKIRKRVKNEMNNFLTCFKRLDVMFKIEINKEKNEIGYTVSAPGDFQNTLFWVWTLFVLSHSTSFWPSKISGLNTSTSIQSKRTTFYRVPWNLHESAIVPTIMPCFLVSFIRSSMSLPKSVHLGHLSKHLILI